MLKIVRTYRNSQEVIDIAGNFIQRNKEQISKQLISPKHIEDPVLIYTFTKKIWFLRSPDAVIHLCHPYNRRDRRC